VGNFIGGELWGRTTDLPWGVIFPRTGDGVPRHPSQLYEFALEGVLMFALLWWFSARPRPRMAVSGLFLLLYGSFRSLIELVRQPDEQLGFLAFDWLTMGQLLSVPMVVAGALLMLLAYRRKVSA
jgi:phosphatidylglycerol:prolipoprotein diacylglycerol transferase